MMIVKYSVIVLAWIVVSPIMLAVMGWLAEGSPWMHK